MLFFCNIFISIRKEVLCGRARNAKNQVDMALYIGFFSRSSHSQMFFKIGVLKHFVIFTGKKLCWRRGLACNFIGKRFTTGPPLLRILRNFSEQLFQQSPYGVSFCFFLAICSLNFLQSKCRKRKALWRENIK